MKDYQYLCSCCDLSQPLDVEGLNQMIRDAKDVTYQTFRGHAAGLAQWAKEKGYAPREDQGLALKNDFHVSYHKSKILGHPCYYLRWSAIEFIWVQFPTKVFHEERRETPTGPQGA